MRIDDRRPERGAAHVSVHQRRITRRDARLHREPDHVQRAGRRGPALLGPALACRQAPRRSSRTGQVMPPPRQAIEEQVSRLLASPVFSKSDRMSRFLRFIVDRTVAGQGADLKEYTIALEVFDKDDSFDPRIDPTVRSEARRLRAKLAEYYESADDRILIELPKGSYAAV